MSNYNISYSEPIIDFFEFKDFENIDVELVAESSFSQEIEMNEDEYFAIAKLTIKINEELETKVVPFKLNLAVSFMLEWKEGDEVSEEVLENISTRVLFYFSRDLIAKMTNSSRFPVLNLPILDIEQKLSERNN